MLLTGVGAKVKVQFLPYTMMLKRKMAQKKSSECWKALTAMSGQQRYVTTKVGVVNVCVCVCGLTCSNYRPLLT